MAVPTGGHEPHTATTIDNFNRGKIVSRVHGMPEPLQQHADADLQ